MNGGIPLHLVALPLFFALVLLLAASLYYSARQGWHRTRTSRSTIYKCSACAHVYVDARDVPVSRCPRCGRMNEAVRR